MDIKDFYGIGIIDVFGDINNLMILWKRRLFKSIYQIKKDLTMEINIVLSILF